MNEETDNIKHELKELGCSILTEMQSGNDAFLLPKQYFSQNEMLIKEKGLLFPYSKEKTFQLPENYFKDFDLNFIIEDNKGDDSSLETLDSIGKIQAPFEVPKNYFDNLHLDILKEEETIIKEKSEAKLVSLFQNLNKYVAAAIILVLVSVGSNFFLRLKEMKNTYNSLQEMNIHHELADIPTEEILNYLNVDSRKKIAHFADPNAYNNPLNIINKDKVQDSKNTDIEVIQSLNEEDPVF